MNTLKDRIFSFIVWAGVAVVILAGGKFLLTGPGDQGAGNVSYSPGGDTSYMFSTVASRSQKGVIAARASKVQSVIIQSDTNNLRYFQMFDQTTNPTGASTPLFVLEIPAATASGSMTVLDSSNFAPGIAFQNGAAWAISSSYGSYASASVQAAKFNVLINYK